MSYCMGLRIDYSICVDQVSVLYGSTDRLQFMCGPVCPYCMGPRIDYELFVDPVFAIDGAADRL